MSDILVFEDHTQKLRRARTLEEFPQNLFQAVDEGQQAIILLPRSSLSEKQREGTITIDASYITWDLSPNDPSPDQIFEREKNSFAKLKETLLNDPNYLNKYIAVVGGKVVDSDYDDSVLAERVYKMFGYIPLFIGKITRKERVVELPSPERA